MAQSCCSFPVWFGNWLCDNFRNDTIVGRNVGPSLTGMEKFGLLDSLTDWMMPYSSSFHLRPSLNVYCLINFLREDFRPWVGAYFFHKMVKPGEWEYWSSTYSLWHKLRPLIETREAAFSQLQNGMMLPSLQDCWKDSKIICISPAGMQ